MAHSYDFVTVGDNCIDRYSERGDLNLVGGNAVNVAAQLSLLGNQVAYFGAVGDDEDGRWTLRVLEDIGVVVDHVRIEDKPTAYSLIRHDAHGDREIYFEEFGASGTYQPTKEEIDIIGRSGHLHIGWLKDGGVLNRHFSSAPTTISRDLSVNARSEDLNPNGLDIAVLSARTEAEAEIKVAELLRSGVGLAIVTMGALGSLATNGFVTRRLDAKLIDAVDTTGAGDAFIAGFLSEFKLSKDIEASLAKGREVATKACLHWGGFPQ